MLRNLLIYLGFINPFTHRPGDFILRIVPTSFSDDYVNFEYSANGGRDWELVQSCHAPYILHSSDEYWYTMEDLRIPLNSGNLAQEKEKFSSYQKILDYEKKETEECKSKNDDLRIKREKRIKDREEAYKRANS